MLAGGSIDGIAGVRVSDGSGGAGVDVDAPTAGSSHRCSSNMSVFFV